MEEIMKELCSIRNHINDVEIKLSQFYDNAHAQSTDGINESESTIVDMETAIALLDARVAALEAKEE